MTSKKIKPLRVLVMVQKGLTPPDSLNGFTEDQISEWKIEYDVISNLKKLKHEVTTIELYDNLDTLKKTIDELKPHIAFNLLEEFPEYPFFDHHVISFLELQKTAYTGCNPRGLTLAKDKALSKKILTYHRVQVPQFYLFPLRKKVADRKYIYPLIVKSVSDEGSSGISKASLVRSFDKLAERVAHIHEKTNTHAIAEQFIEGREIYVGVIGNRTLRSFHPWELTISNKNGDDLIATSKMKWNTEYQNKAGVNTGRADLDNMLTNRFHKVSKRIYKILSLSGYARMDFRLSAEGNIYFIEANPNPMISDGEDFAASAKDSGMKYPDLLQKILTLGMSYEPWY